VSQVGDSRHRLEFEPVDTGPHTIDIKYGGQPVQGSPYIANVYDVSRVRLVDPPSSGVVGDDVQFTGQWRALMSTISFNRGISDG